jgi:hypothetical protein
MAKPGQGARDEMARLAAMSREAADLSSGPAPPELVERLRPQIEGQLGMRCAGCGERIGVGFKFTQVGVSIVEGKPTADVAYLSACNGDSGCNFAAEAREHATAVEMVEFVWLDEEGQSEGSLREPPVPERSIREARANEAEDEAFAEMQARAPRVGPVRDGAEFRDGSAVELPHARLADG